MQNNQNFKSLVVVAIASWAAVAGLFAISAGGDAPSAGVHSVATAFPTAEASFALRPVPAKS